MTTLEELYFGKLNPENTAYNNKEYKMAKEQFYRKLLSFSVQIFPMKTVNFSTS